MTKELERYLKLREERPAEFKDGNLHIVYDEEVIREFEKKTGRTIGVVYESPFRLLVVDLVYATPGKYFAYERLMPAVPKGAVVTIPVINGKFLLLKQFRHSTRGMEYAFPRGFAEAGLSPEQNAAKELGEEVAANIVSMEEVGTVIADSGLMGDPVHVYECVINDFSITEGYEEIHSAITLSPEEMRDWIREGKIRDGFTLAALTLAKNYPYC